jgi:hypothetical protein
VWYAFNSGWGSSTSLTIAQLTTGNLNAALYANCGDPQYIECWTGVDGALDITADVMHNTDYLIRVWNGGGSEAGNFAICVEGDFNTGMPFDGLRGTTSVYPNPASDVLHVHAVGDMRTLAVIDLQGRVVLTAPTQGREDIVLPISSLAPGSYLVRTSDGRMLGRFVKA